MHTRHSKLHHLKTHATTIIFIVGFLFDMAVLPDIGHTLTRYIGGVYLILIAFFIVFREWVISRNTASTAEQKIYSLTTFLISYFSGSALSFVCVYALRSAELLVSWPLFLILFICIIANEVVSTHSFRFSLDVGVFLTALLFYVIFNTPLVLNVQNDMTFMVSILVTMGISFLYVYLLQFTSESARYEAPRSYALAVGIPIFVSMLYFLNVIPAVPLSLEEGSVYHEVTRDSSGEFFLRGETDTRMLAAFRTPVYHFSSSDTGVYFFSAIHAPVMLTAPVSHVWEYYNQDTQRWDEKAVISFGLAGGRADGYRAYSYKEGLQKGLWRVTVQVDRRRVVGRVKFIVTEGEAKLVTTKK